MAEGPNTVEMADDFVEEVVETSEEGHKQPHWHRHVAITTLVMALLTALAAMLAGMSSHQALLERTLEIIEINSLEGDQFQVEIFKSKHEILTALGEMPDQAEVKAIASIEDEVQELKPQVDIEEDLVLSTMETHNFFAAAAALLSLGTALDGMSVIVNRKYLWVAGLVFGAMGTVGLVWGVIRMVVQ